MNRATITLPEQDGKPVKLDINGNFLAVATSNNVVKVWDVSKREAKVLAQGRPFEAGYAAVSFVVIFIRRLVMSLYLFCAASLCSLSNCRDVFVCL